MTRINEENTVKFAIYNHKWLDITKNSSKLNEFLDLGSLYVQNIPKLVKEYLWRETPFHLKYKLCSRYFIFFLSSNFVNFVFE